MSTALAVPRPDHATAAEPDRSSPIRPRYQPITPSRPSPKINMSSSGPTSISPKDKGRVGSSGAPSTRTAQPQSVSPSDGRSSAKQPARVEIKTEALVSPGASGQSTAARRRPQKLDLNTQAAANAEKPTGPMTAKESAGLSALHDIATACLSPGFDPSDPKMRQQMERSRDLAEQQRLIIAARQKKGGPGEASSSKGPSDLGPPPSSFSKPLGTSRRKAPPSMLSLAAAGSQYNEPRVIQSAPINQTFTGLHRPHPLSRQVFDQPQYPRREETQPSPHPPLSAHRLPPISDLVRSDAPPAHKEYEDARRPTHHLNRSNSGPDSRSSLYAPQQPPVPAHSPTVPGNGAHSAYRAPDHPISAKPQHAHNGLHLAPRPEPRSADEAVQSIEGREDTHRVVYYGGRQPPTPNSPLPAGHAAGYEHSPRGMKIESAGTGRRRTREEYERDHDAADADERERERERARRAEGLGFGFGAWTNDSRVRHSPESQRRRREEFMGLAARMWDLLQG